MFEGFIEDTIEGAGASLFIRHAGAEGRLPLVLLHGYPQTSAMWHQIAPLLTNDFLGSGFIN